MAVHGSARRLAAIALFYVALAAAASSSLAEDAGSAPAVSSVDVRAVVIPTGFEGKHYTALAQIVVAGSPLADANWELGLVVRSQRQTAEEHDGSVTVTEAATPAVLEILTTFRPGTATLTAAARETSAGLSGTHSFDVFWPDPINRTATVSPIAIVQPVVATFRRGSASRRRGALGLGDDQQLTVTRPAALVSVVCRGAKTRAPLRVERRLVGDSPVYFDPIPIPSDGEPCAQVRDLIGPGTMTPGFFKYEVRVFDGELELAVGAREFRAAAQEPARPRGESR